MRKSNLLWIFAIAAIFVFLILNVVFSVRISETRKSLTNLRGKASFNFTTKIELQSSCPDSVGGNNESYLRIKYFYSDYCPWCRKEEPILQKLVMEHGDWFYLEWFNIGSCDKDVDKYKVSGVPTFIFSTADEQKEYSHYGFIYENDLEKLICDVSGGC